MTGSIYPINMDYAICLKKQQGFGCLSLSTLTAGDGKKITLLWILHKLDGSCDDKTKQSIDINDTYSHHYHVLTSLFYLIRLKQN